MKQLKNNLTNLVLGQSKRPNLSLGQEYRFEDYIKFLRENLVNLVEYRERTGTIDPNVLRIKEDLFDDDPFIVFNATLAATVVLSDKSIYH